MLLWLTMPPNLKGVGLQHLGFLGQPRIYIHMMSCRNQILRDDQTRQG